MTSGVYLMEFENGKANYIGKSVDMERRWKEHEKSLVKGNAAYAVQDAFAKYGLPKFSILLECHADHIDLMESIYITQNWDKQLLNTSIPIQVPIDDMALLITASQAKLLGSSTAEHIRLILRMQERVDGLINDLSRVSQDLKHLKTSDGYYELYGEIAELEQDKRNLTIQYNNILKDNLRITNELAKERNKGFWARLLG